MGVCRAQGGLPTGAAICTGLCRTPSTERLRWGKGMEEGIPGGRHSLYREPEKLKSRVTPGSLTPLEQEVGEKGWRQ